MKTLKKTISIFLVLAMLFAFVPSALAVAKDVKTEPYNGNYSFADSAKTASDRTTVNQGGTDLTALEGTAVVSTTDTSDGRLENATGMELDPSDDAADEVAKYELNVVTETFGFVPSSAESPDTTKFDVVAFSVDNGAKWKAGAPTEKDIAKLFNKGGTLVVTDSFDTKTKKPTKGEPFKDKVVTGDDIDGSQSTNSEPTSATATEGYQYTVGGVTKEVTAAAIKGAIVVTYPTIEPRPKDTKLSVNYALAADDTGASAGKWILATKGSKTLSAKDFAILAVLDICIPADGKKPTAEDTYYQFPISSTFDPDNDGVEVMPVGEDGKPFKTTFFVKQSPYKDTASSKIYPASKGYKVSASSQIKAPSLKPDYKKNVVKVKAGVAMGVSDTDDTPPGTYTLYSKTVGTPSGSVAVPKDGVPFDTANKEVWAFTYATEKKPSSAKQQIVLAPVADTPIGTPGSNFNLGEFAVSDKGKLTYDKKALEFLDGDPTKAGVKWGNFPKLTASKIIYVRAKNTAKQDKGEFSNGVMVSKAVDGTTRASAPNEISVTYANVNQAAIDEATAAKATDPKVKVPNAKKGVTSVNHLNLEQVLGSAAYAKVADASGSAGISLADNILTYKNGSNDAAELDITGLDDFKAVFNSLAATGDSIKFSGNKISELTLGAASNSLVLKAGAVADELEITSTAAITVAADSTANVVNLVSTSSAAVNIANLTLDKFILSGAYTGTLTGDAAATVVELTGTATGVTGITAKEVHVTVDGVTVPAVTADVIVNVASGDTGVTLGAVTSKNVTVLKGKVTNTDTIGGDLTIGKDAGNVTIGGAVSGTTTLAGGTFKGPATTAYTATVTGNCTIDISNKDNTNNATGDITFGAASVEVTFKLATNANHYDIKGDDLSSGKTVKAEAKNDSSGLDYTFTIGTSAIASISPANGAQTSDDTIKFVGSATTGATVTVTVATGS